MAKLSHILGMNARNQLYASLNSSRAKRYGFSKYVAKNFLQKHGVGVAKLYAMVSTQEEFRAFDFSSIEGGFAVKPSNGSAGKGVIVIKSRKRGEDVWVDIEDREWTEEDLRLHVSDILAGQYSTWNTTRSAIIEERIPVHPDLAPYVPIGTPDVRVILFNNIPVMAMTRLPTHASGGRANLDQGAIGLGIDMGTGKTLFGVSGKKEMITYFPDTQIPVSDIQIPTWIKTLRTATRTANATGLRYMGVDIFLHPERGPLVAEVNAYPGLSIQLCNQAGLRKRLERLEGITARNVNHAVKIGQSLFAESFSSFVESEGDIQILSHVEEVALIDDDDRHHDTKALMNTGREMSAIAYDLAMELNLVDPNDLLWMQQVAGEGKAAVVEVRYKLQDSVYRSPMIVTKKLNDSPYKIQLGRNDLEGFFVGVNR
ncbi:MAG: Alpha-L-glutamate ligase-like protein [Microgenomates group bacterium GW2011_GWF2_45_18]|nr:MAG: Alpha-L-glutamate ligase-like protein [Microgenomates group bacterium GW2011_GWF1_44_10]KKU01688.1 MAG: Alpha-L-glutamate ligase-like protein [Microgenomates group bacterium GW2011_GWF2_45_18]HAU99543.1 hypothetical protein [Candidatus Paceibacterota bacterium]HAX01467.1 hypothetical protein [Candidatus Paceibacterota bacterium]